MGTDPDDLIARAARAAADEIAERIEKSAEEAGEMEWQLGASGHGLVGFSKDALFEIILRRMRAAWALKSRGRDNRPKARVWNKPARPYKRRPAG